MEFKKEKVYTPLVATPTHNVSQAIKYGNLVFVSGMVGEDENEVLMDGLEAQCERAFLNMKNVLESAGSSLEKVSAKSLSANVKIVPLPTRCGIVIS